MSIAAVDHTKQGTASTFDTATQTGKCIGSDEDDKTLFHASVSNVIIYHTGADSSRYMSGSWY